MICACGRLCICMRAEFCGGPSEEMEGRWCCTGRSIMKTANVRRCLRMVDSGGLLISGAELPVSATAVLGTRLRMTFVRLFGISWNISVCKGYWLEYRVMIPVMARIIHFPSASIPVIHLSTGTIIIFSPWIRSVDLFRHQRINRDHTGYSLVCSDHTGYSLPYCNHTGFSLPYTDHTGYSLPCSDHTGN
jgi:hypothetical protein